MIDQRRNQAFARAAGAMFGNASWRRVGEELDVYADDAWSWMTGREEVPMSALLDMRRLLMKGFDYGDPEIRAAVAAIDELL